MGVVHN